jgi:hypothetical protein
VPRDPVPFAGFSDLKSAVGLASFRRATSLTSISGGIPCGSKKPRSGGAQRRRFVGGRMWGSDLGVATAWNHLRSEGNLVIPPASAVGNLWRPHHH